MLQAAKTFVVLLSAVYLNACASAFSAYKSDFSCKNSDHGGCAHPLDAYADAKNEDAPTFAGTASAAPVDIIEEHLEGEPFGHAHTLEQSDYQSYQDASYSELEALIALPETPVLAPAKTVRTLILPYTDPKASSRLYMPRYVYSVLENSRFVLGNYLTNKDNGSSLSDLIGMRPANQNEEQE